MSETLDPNDLSRFEGSAAIAVIGIGCLFPDAPQLEQYWENIQRGHDAIGPIPLSHWRPSDYFDSDPKRADHTYAQTGGFLKPYAFDPLQFGLAPHALEATDSTQLLGMVAAHQAMVDAGYGPERSFDKQRVSCLIGVTGTLELVIPLGARLGHPIWKQALDKAGVAPEIAAEVMAEIAHSYVPWQENSFPGLLGNVVAGRIANRLNLGGTNSVVDAACASSLAALHMAVMELQAGHADMVITGGMDTFNDIFMYMCFSKTPALSPSGQARPFDAEGDGTILGEGLGALVLKRLDRARADRDRVYAVIRGIGSSSDGKGQAIYAPNAKGQVKALERAYAAAGVSPRSIGLVEAHGTGTKVGDGVELDALAQVYGPKEAGDGGAWCSLGSVKSQIGHTKAAAGAAGLIKAVMALHHKVLPPTIKVNRLHPRLEGSPFVLAPKARPWLAPFAPRRAAVSAFGFGGSNYHCVVEEAQAQKQHVSWDPQNLLALFSAKDGADLLDVLRQALGELTAGHDARISARRWRHAYAPDQLWRLGIVARGDDELKERMLRAETALAQGQLVSSQGIYFERERVHGALAFVFAGQGSQSLGMMSDLACRFPEFLEELERGEIFLQKAESRSLGHLIYPPMAAEAAEQKAQAEALTATRYAQLALAVVGLGILRVLARFGVKADVFAGHSFGELLALTAAGVWKSEDLLRAAYERGRLMSEKAKAGGRLLAVLCAHEKAAPHLEGLDVVPANFNAPEQVVFGGDAETLKEAAKRLKAAGIGARSLDVSAAFHTPWVSAAVEPFATFLEGVEFAPMENPVYCNRRAALYADEPSAMRVDLAQQIGQPVLFGTMLSAMQKDGVATFVEIGPSRKLQGIMKANVGDEVLSADGELSGLAQLLVQLSLRGIPVDWSEWDPGSLESHATAGKFQVMISGANYRSPTPERVSRLARADDRTASSLAPASAAAAAERSTEQVSRARSMSGPSALHAARGAGRELRGGFENEIAATAETRSSALETGSPASANSPSISSETGSPAFANSSSFSSETGSPAFASEPRSSASASETRSRAPATSASSPVSRSLLSHEVSMSPSHPEDLQRMEQLLRDMQEMQRRTTEAHTLFLENQRQFQSMLRAVLLQESPSVSQAHASSAQNNFATSLPQESGQRPAAQGSNYNSANAAAPRDANYGSATQGSKHRAPHTAAATLASGASATRSSGAARETAAQGSMPAAAQNSASAGAHRIIDGAIAQSASTSGSQGSLREDAVAAQTTAASNADQKAASARDPSQTIFEIIGQSTGYPAAMLEASMDLESDLGIDSIKKVEICSAVQQVYPEVKAEEMSATQTIADLIELSSRTLSAPLPDAEASAKTERVGAWAAGTVALVHAAVEPNRAMDTQEVLRLVAEKTGFPESMLSSELELESDLGIDSIKRVEILSSLQERFPQLAALPPDQLQDARTIGDLELLLGADAAPADEAVALETFNATHQNDEKIYQIIAEKTGYPRDVISPDMELESDLGIDSIKRVEILSALSEAIPSLAEVAPDTLSKAQTIGDFLVASRVKEDESVAAALLDPELAQHWDLSEKKKSSGLAEAASGSPLTPTSAAAAEDAATGSSAAPAQDAATGFPQANAEDVAAGLPKLNAQNASAGLDPSSAQHAAAGVAHANAQVAMREVSTSVAQSAAGDLTASTEADGLSEAAAAPSVVATLNVQRLEASIFEGQKLAQSLAKDREYWIVDDGSNLARNMMLKLQERGVNARLISLAMQDRWPVSDQLSGIFLLAPLKFEGSAIRWLMQAFSLLRKVGPQLQKRSNDSMVVTITRHGGRFGLDGLQNLNQTYAGGVAALVKTIDKEWPGVHARALDLGKDFADGFEAALRVIEAAGLEGPLELGVTRDHLYELQLKTETAQSGEKKAALAAGDLVLVTGGARGVTAAALHALAAQYQPHFLIWGRSSLEREESEELQGITDAAQLKQLLLAGNPDLRHPKELERAYQATIAARELRTNIKSLEALGAVVTYQVVDVSKDSELRTAFEAMTSHGLAPRAVIHGAGVLRDRLMLEQKDEDFTLVLDTKLKILPYLEDLARKGTDQFVLFSSSTARFGRRGQVAYGIANEVLNKTAHYLRSLDARALAMNWGPWDGGMVQEGLKKIFAAEGVATIPLDTGAELLLSFLESPAIDAGEWVVIAENKEVTEEASSAIDSWEVSLAQTPILADHILKYRAVAPAALLLEWMAQAALHTADQGFIQRIENFQIWKGLTLGAQDVSFVESAIEAKDQTSGGIGIKLQAKHGNARPYAHASFYLGAQRIPPPTSIATWPEPRLRKGADLYEEILFHGEKLQFIDQIGPSDAKGLWAEISLSGEPQDWSLQGLGQTWAIHAPLLDSIFQLAIVWSSEQRSLRCLPSRVGRLELYAAIEARVRVQLEVQSEHGAALALRARVYNEEGALLWQADGVEMIMDAGLKIPFAQNRIRSESWI